MTSALPLKTARDLAERATAWFDALGTTAVTGQSNPNDPSVSSRGSQVETQPARSWHSERHTTFVDSLRPWQALLLMVFGTAVVLALMIAPLCILDALFGLLHGAQLRAIIHN